MKKIQFISKILQLVIFIFLFFSIEKSECQTYFQTGATQTIMCNTGGTTGNVGIGTSSPSGKLNVRSNNSVTNTPIFEVNPLSGLGVNQGSFKTFVSIGSQIYGIYQSSSINNVLNYLQDPLKVGHLKFYLSKIKSHMSNCFNR